MRKQLFVIFLVATASFFAVRAQAQVIIIANPSFKGEVISKGVLRDVFTGESKFFKDGSRALPVLLSKGAAHDSFYPDCLHMSESSVIISWRRQVFSGKVSMPPSFDSEAAIVEYVAKTSGAIGFISKSAPHEGVKVLSID
ncbi:MAG: hypothetical protein ABSE51_10780 [Terracidiphilus sp.]|jgi:hypothetical protein